jgi:hypothetical protein
LSPRALGSGSATISLANIVKIVEALGYSTSEVLARAEATIDASGIEGRALIAS